MRVHEAIELLKQEDPNAELVFATFTHGDTTLRQMLYFRRPFYGNLKVLGRDSSMYSPSRAACIITGALIERS